jgi:Taurine catabolism dioxygenase TauD, TfdA family
MRGVAERICSHAAEWVGRDLRSCSDWIHRFSAPELDELDAAVAALTALGKPLREVTATDFVLRELGPAVAAWRAMLESGRGFVLVRGFPVRRYSETQAALAYWLIGRHLGEPVSQNHAGDVLGHVRDTGAAPNSREVRLYKTRAELSFHTDGADIIGLFCLRAAQAGGISRIASSVAVYNEIVRRRPDLAALLFERFPNYMPGSDGRPGSVFHYPIATIDGAVFRMLFLGWYIRDAQALPETPRLTPAQQEVIELLEQIPNEPGMALDMQFAEGDMQFLKNSVILHARTQYQDGEQADEKRHLLRLWLTAKSFRDGDDALRGGIPPPTVPVPP